MPGFTRPWVATPLASPGVAAAAVVRPPPVELYHCKTLPTPSVEARCPPIRWDRQGVRGAQNVCPLGLAAAVAAARWWPSAAPEEVAVRGGLRFGAIPRGA